MTDELFPGWLDAVQAADELSTCPETIKRLIRTGVLPARKVYGKWLIERTVLGQFAHTYGWRPHIESQSLPGMAGTARKGAR